MCWPSSEAWGLHLLLDGDKNPQIAPGPVQTGRGEGGPGVHHPSQLAVTSEPGPPGSGPGPLSCSGPDKGPLVLFGASLLVELQPATSSTSSWPSPPLSSSPCHPDFSSNCSYSDLPPPHWGRASSSPSMGSLVPWGPQLLASKIFIFRWPPAPAHGWFW